MWGIFAVRLKGMNQVFCFECGFEFPERLHNEPMRTPCPACGATKRRIKASIHESVRAYDGFGYRIKDPKKTGKSKIKSEGFTKYATSQKAPLVKHSRDIDRETNRYSESVINVDTGAVIHSCDEPLKKHTGHGSAKKKKN
jgi:predicted nucleic acid-binding Zn ribbon protein